MKICMIVGRFDPEHTMYCGINEYTDHLSCALAELGHQVQSLQHGGGRRDWGVRRLVELCRLIETEQPAVVHLQYQPDLFNGSPWVGSYPFFIKRAKTDVVFVTTLHGLWHPSRLSPTRWYGRWLVRSSDGVIVTNVSDRDRVLRAHPDVKQKLAVIPVGANVNVTPITAERRNQIRQDWGVGPDGLVLMNFGFPRDDKGLHDVVRALALVRRMGIPAIFVHVGEVRPIDRAYVADLDRLVGELGIAPHVRWLGALPEHVISAYLQAADVYVAPYTDGFSTRRTSAIVALTHSLPLVTTLNGPTADKAEYDDAIAFTPPRNAVALSDTLVRLAQDPSERLRLSSAGHRLAARFSQASAAEEHVALYCDMMDRLSVGSTQP